MLSKLKLCAGTIAVAVLVGPIAQGTPLDTRAGAIAGANRLLAVQHANGAFPWYVTDPADYQNVQGITAVGLLDAYKVSLDPAYLAAAKETRDWLASYRDTGCGTPPCLLSLANVFFLGEYALLSLTPADFALARAALQQVVALRGGSGITLANYVIDARKTQGHTNLGLWDAALYVRAAQDVGDTALADEIANTLATQTIVNPFDPLANWYELGLAGVALGLSEADLLTHAGTIDAALTALKATQGTNGSFPVTFGGVVYPDDTQATAYAVMAMLSAVQLESAFAGADFLLSTQRLDGSFAPYVPDDASEIAEVDAEAVSALVAATLIVPNGALAYADAARALL
jgi:hypothetical protein